MVRRVPSLRRANRSPGADIVGRPPARPLHNAHKWFGRTFGPLRLRAFDTPGAGASVEAPVVEDPVEAALLKEYGS